MDPGGAGATISGEAGEYRLVSIKVIQALVCLLFFGGGFCIFFRAANRRLPRGDPLGIAAIAFFPVMGLLAYWLMTLSLGRKVVEFTCDESTFRYRTLRSSGARTRFLSDVTKVEEARGRYGPIGWEVAFRDGETALIGRRLPNAKALADRLYAHRQPAPPEPSGLGNVIRFMFRGIEYVPISSPKTDARVRRRYQSEIATLTGLGFEYKCCYGEAFPMTRLALILPAIVVLMELIIERTPMRIRGTKIMLCYPLLISNDQTTYANPSENGVKLYTAFTDGSCLISAMGESSAECAGPMLTKWCGAASIPELCTSHQRRIEEFEAAGKRVNRQPSLHTYFAMSERETAVL